MGQRRKKNACKILISCEEPSENGEMQVSMTCEGDEVLVSYLLKSAQSMVDHGPMSPSKLSSSS